MATEAKFKIYNGSTWEEYTFPPRHHTHSIKIEQDNTVGSVITLDYGKTYRLTAGGSGYGFTMPAANGGSGIKAVSPVFGNQDGYFEITSLS